MHLPLQSNVSIDGCNILLFFLLVKGLSWLGVSCVGCTHMADNFSAVLFSCNSHEVKVALVSLSVYPNQHG